MLNIKIVSWTLGLFTAISFIVCVIYGLIVPPMGSLFKPPAPPFGLDLNLWLFFFASAAILYPSWPFFVSAILSDGDVVFQPRKIERSGIRRVVENRVLIRIHKERELECVERLYP